MPDEVKHTAGPWVIEVFPARDSLDGENAATCVMSHANTDGKEGSVVAQVNRWSYGDSPPSTESDANARLIAAAPELLTLCKFGLSRFCDPHTLSYDPAARHYKATAEALLAKIEGAA